MANKNLPDFFRSGSAWNPIREMNRFQRQINRMFDDFWSPAFGNKGLQQFLYDPEIGMGGMEFSPPCDIEETDKHYLVSFDVPGVKKEDVKIELRDHQLTISGERKEEHKEEKSNRLSMERYSGSFLRTFMLPSNVEPEKIEASYEDGVLRIAVAKSEVSQPRQISVHEGKGLFQKLLGRGEKEMKGEKKIA